MFPSDDVIMHYLTIVLRNSRIEVEYLMSLGDDELHSFGP